MRIGQRMVMDDFCHVEELLSGKVWAALREGSEGFGIQGASRRARIDAEILKRLADRSLYPLPQQALTRKGVKVPGRSRPAFVHELFREFGQKRLALDQTLTLTPVYPLRLTVDWPSIDHSKPSVIEEFSPFLDVSDFAKSLGMSEAWRITSSSTESSTKDTPATMSLFETSYPRTALCHL